MRSVEDVKAGDRIQIYVTDGCLEADVRTGRKMQLPEQEDGT